MIINGIVALSKNNGIGKNNAIPWYLKSDLKRFQKLTTGNGNNAVIMGKNTWNSIPFLKNRDHFILSTSLNIHEKKENQSIISFKNIDELFLFLKQKNYDSLWVIGGSQIYDLFMKLNIINELFITVIDEDYDCDTFFPEIPSSYLIKEEQVLHEKTSNNNNIKMVIYKSTYHNTDYQ
tara:strand:- start:2989 stop:3522 length:534 start_codon:yes stop_codon:yes gene_type:complete